MEGSTGKRRRPAHGLARRVLLPPLLGGAAVLCLLAAVALSFGRGAKADNPLVAVTQDVLAQQLSVDLEGTPTRADVRRAVRPLSERQRLLRAHPYHGLYRIARAHFGVSTFLVAAIHYQETGFGEAPATLAERSAWRRHRGASAELPRPTRYPNRSKRHPSVKDDFDVVMAIAADLKSGGARGLGTAARRAVAARYGTGADGRLATAMVVERARAWRLLGTLPLPGTSELATPAKGVVGGCGYFGCPRPGHLHNGVDFLAPTGTPIHAAAEGVVALIESTGQSGGYGNFACIQHRPNLATCYAHMSAVAAALRVGSRVRRGQVIGLVGSTGNSSAPHLHFEVRRGPAQCSTCTVDPLPLLSGDVPGATLPDMTAVAPDRARAPGGAPAAITASPPAAAPPAIEESARRVRPRARNRATPAEPASDGAAPRAPAPAPTTPVPEPRPTQVAPERPAQPPAQPPAPAPAPPPEADAGTGGVAPAASPPAARPP